MSDWACNVGLAPSGGSMLELSGDHMLGINYASLIHGYVCVRLGSLSVSP